MDLREKPGKVQKILEILMRIRLISIVALVVTTVAIAASHWQDVVSLLVGASGAIVEWTTDFNLEKAWASGQYLIVTAIAMVVLFTIFGKLRGGIASLISTVLFVGSLILMDGNENFMPFVFLGVLLVVSVVAIIVAKFSVACGLFPFVLSWLFLSSLIAVLQPSLEPAYLVWAVLSALGFAGAMALSVVTGKYLGEGMPQAGAIAKAAKQMVAPILAVSIMAVCAIAYDMPKEVADATGGADVWGAILYFFVFNLWFFVILFPIMTFAPWERLRAGSRRVEIKEKKDSGNKKTSAKGKKK